MREMEIVMGDELRDENKKKLIPQNETNQNGESDFEFMREKIKNRPVNKRKLLKRTATTAGMAVVFGLVACVTFLLLEPVVSNWLNPKEDLVSEVTFPEEAIEEEMKIEDMIIEEEVVTESTEEEEAVQATIVEQRVPLEITDYTKLYSKLYSVATDGMKSMVLVQGVTKDKDWMSYSYDNTQNVCGLIVADNGQDLLIVTQFEKLKKATRIQVTFCNNAVCEAEVLSRDAETGMCVIGVPLDQLTEVTLSRIAYASLGNSNGTSLNGTVMIAIGAPMGNYGSVGYGMVTGSGNLIQAVDVNYRFFTTDIYCSQMANGVVLNTKGQVMGFIDQNRCAQDMKNQLCVVGISELKKTIERLSNVDPRIYAGIRGMDVSLLAHDQYGVPYGAFVTEVELYSPAMTCGIQSGDVIIQYGEKVVSTFNELAAMIRQSAGNDTVKVVVMRYSNDEYKEMEVELVLEERED